MIYFRIYLVANRLFLSTLPKYNKTHLENSVFCKLESVKLPQSISIISISNFTHRFSQPSANFKNYINKRQTLRQPADKLLNIAPLHFNFWPAGI